jgi:hypothetical protein
MKRVYDIEKVDNIITAVGYRLLSTDYHSYAKQKLEIECNIGHRYFSSLDNFIHGKRCPICANTRRSTARKTITIDYVKNYVSKFGYTCISDKYILSNKKLDMLCQYGHKINITWNNFQSGYRCKLCSTHNRRKYSIENTSSYKYYKEYIDLETNKNYIIYYYTINPNKLPRTYTEYHLDHKYSIADGFRNSIDPNLIAHPVNLQMLYWKDNIAKHDKSCITLDKLHDLYYKFTEST